MLLGFGRILKKITRTNMRHIAILAFALILVGAGCSAPATDNSADNNQVSGLEDRVTEDIGDTSRVGEVEKAFELELPDDATIKVVLENDGYYSALGYSALSVEELKGHFVEMFEGLSLSVKRDFDVVPVPNGTSALYEDGSNNWALFLREEGDYQAFEIIRQAK